MGFYWNNRELFYKHANMEPSHSVSTLQQMIYLTPVPVRVQYPFGLKAWLYTHLMCPKSKSAEQSTHRIKNIICANLALELAIWIFYGTYFLVWKIVRRKTLVEFGGQRDRNLGHSWKIVWNVRRAFLAVRLWNLRSFWSRKMGITFKPLSPPK